MNNIKETPLKGGGMRVRSRLLAIARPLRGLKKYHSTFINTLDVIDLNNTIMHVMRVHSDHFTQASGIASTLHTDFSTTAQLVLVVRILRIVGRLLRNKLDEATSTEIVAATSMVVLYVLYADV
jgi:hypothetical protein